MAVHRIRKGLDLPIAGGPEQKIGPSPAPGRVGIIAADYVGMRPTMRVAPGDAVKRGQILFEDKKNPGVVFTAPGAGTVVAVNRGERRALLSVTVDLNEAERAGQPEPGDRQAFSSYTGKTPLSLTRGEIQALLIESGLWTAFRTRPFSKVPVPGTEPHSIFVTAMDTNPLAPSVDAVIEGKEEDFETGLMCVVKLTDGATYLCKAPKSSVPANPNTGVLVEEFEGVHPAGTPGVHIHLLDPAHREKTVWHAGYQDVVAIGRLFSKGVLDVSRTVSLAGPMVKRPRLIETRLGAAIDDLVAGELGEGEPRVVSGSVLSGRAAMGEIHGYLGRYHNQISVLREGRDRRLLGWLAPGANTFSVTNLFLSRLMGGKKFSFTTNQNGGKRAMVPMGSYERVMPIDVMPTFLLRALVCGDLEQAEQLGCLELDEEDLALCTFVCPSKYDYGPILRERLTEIEREG